MFQIFALSFFFFFLKTFFPRLWLTFPLTAEKSCFSLHFYSLLTKKYIIVKTNKSVSISVILFSFSPSFFFPSMFS